MAQQPAETGRAPGVLKVEATIYMNLLYCLRSWA